MPLNSTPVPSLDVVSWALGRQYAYDQDKPLLVDATDRTHSLSANEARSLVRRLVCGLLAFGLQKGDAVCIVSHNDIMFPIIALGIIGAGGAYAAANPQYTAEELAHLFGAAKPRFVVAEKALLDKVAAASEEYDTCKIFGYHSTESVREPGFLDFHDLLTCGSSDWISFDDERTAQQTPAGLFLTSGTTGLPKLAVRTHKNFVNESVALDDSRDKPYAIRRLISLPIFHAFAAPLAILGPFCGGHPTYIQRRFEINSFLELLQDAEITETVVAPPIITRHLLGDALTSEKKQNLQSLRTVICAGAPLAAAKQLEASKLIAPLGRIVQCYGMTEGGWMTTFQYPEEDYSGSVGRPLPNTDFKLIDESGFEVTQTDALGELVVRSPSVMLEYLNNPAATKATINEDGWLRTGDLGCIKNGKIFLVGRIKELIKVNAYQVAPAEIEEVLASHEDIRESAVFGVADDAGENEMVHILVVREIGSSLQPEDIRVFLLQHLAKQKVQHAVIHFGNHVPRNSSGKILRHVLRDEVKKQQRLAAEVALRLELEPETSTDDVTKNGQVLKTRVDSGACTSPQ
ncbi:uncharacterized protein K452DRAFT_230476 [Aplosporella prunicola CBS 121167]|uniref:AMP-dependent synthetase/ligase domain-containing protein n=1 Tax=Aplosporella prunicola CBS 121167 TaxID=1176127 RepID=A0A6A6B7P6_9PEZI|nr:uncharacterized protein K452DRAFT_230476 [Aplosporella prunicola CBS 121167]KAF2140159.1 hypothetical protein K452DRAFT_230476 [Aplosporella prunicola CBS 121167]